MSGATYSNLGLQVTAKHEPNHLILEFVGEESRWMPDRDRSGSLETFLNEQMESVTASSVVVTHVELLEAMNSSTIRVIVNRVILNLARGARVEIYYDPKVSASTTILALLKNSLSEDHYARLTAIPSMDRKSESSR
jgi:hypothetical protein